MENVNVSESKKTVKVERSFFGMDVNVQSKKLTIIYKESTLIDGELVSSEIKSYERDYEFWASSELGQAVIGMVNLDLSQDNPAISRD